MSRKRRVVVQLSKSEAAALLDALDGSSRWLPSLNNRGNRPALLASSRNKIVAALVRAVELAAADRAEAAA